MNAPQHPLNAEGNGFVPTLLLEAGFPHLIGEEQMGLLRKLPDLISCVSDRLAKFLRPVDAAFFDSQLGTAFAESRNALRMVLFFCAGVAQPLTDSAVEIVGRCLESDDFVIRALAFEITWRSKDKRLLERVRRSDWSADAKPDELGNHYGSGALAMAASDAGDPVPFARLSPHLWGYAVELSQQPDAVEAYARFSGDLLVRMAQSQIEAPSAAIVRHAGGGSGVQHAFAYYGRDEEGEQSAEDPMARLRRFSKGFDPQAWKEENDLFGEHLSLLAKALRDQNLGLLSEFPCMSGFQTLARRAPERLIKLARMLLTINEQGKLTRLKNWVLAMIPAVSTIDSALAVRLYQHVKKARAFVGLISGPAEIPFEVEVLMMADGEGFADERRKKLIVAGSDEQIALLALCAEQNGKGAWLRTFARACIGERQPGRMALGMTILGLCDEASVPTEILGYRDKVGDLAVSANFGVKASERNVWLCHWHDEAREAADLVTMWRFGELMVRSADHRWTLWFDSARQKADSPWARYAQLYEDRLQKRGEKKADERKKTLYGREQPSRLLASLLNFGV